MNLIAWARPVWQVLAGLCLILSLSGCEKAVDSTIRFGLASAPISLDPRYATDATSSRINRLLFQRLVDFDNAFVPTPSLADWEIINSTHYRFRLRDNKQSFVNGKALTTRDVEATYAYILDPANASPHRGSLNLIQEIRVIDDQQIDFYLKRPDPLFPGYLVIGIVPASYIQSETNSRKTAIGSGAFELVNWPSSDRLMIQRRSDKQRIEFIHVQDATVRVLKLLRGEIDLLQNDLPKELVHYLENEDEIIVKHLAGTNFTYMGFNLKDPLLAKKQIRTAIAHAIDKQAIIEYLLGGETKIANTLLTPDHWAGLKTATPYSFDPELSRELLQSIGYSLAKPLELEYKTSSDPFRIRIATIIQQQLAEVGIKVKIRSFDWATFYGDIKNGRFQLYSLSWIGIKNPDIFRYVLHSDSTPPKGANRGYYHNEEVDRVLDEIELTQEQSKRIELYQKLQQIVLQDLPFVPLWYEEHFLAANKSIQGYHLVRDGNYDGLLTINKQQDQ